MSQQTTLELETKFYYHYKHTDDSVNNYAYEMLNIAHHTELMNSDESAMVVYRPLYESAFIYKLGRHWYVRPLSMFTGVVEKDGQIVQRFKEITDPEIIRQLIAIRNGMYFGILNPQKDPPPERSKPTSHVNPRSRSLVKKVMNKSGTDNTDKK